MRPAAASVCSAVDPMRDKKGAVYGIPWYNTWGAFVYIAAILGAGLAWYALRGRHHIGTLASHAAEPATHAPPLPEPTTGTSPR